MKQNKNDPLRNSLLLYLAVTIFAVGAYGTVKGIIQSELRNKVAVLADRLNYRDPITKKSPRLGYRDGIITNEEWSWIYDSLGLDYHGQRGLDLSISQLKTVKKKLEDKLK